MDYCNYYYLKYNDNIFFKLSKLKYFSCLGKVYDIDFILENYEKVYFDNYFYDLNNFNKLLIASTIINNIKNLFQKKNIKIKKPNIENKSNINIFKNLINTIINSKDDIMSVYNSEIYEYIDIYHICENEINNNHFVKSKLFIKDNYKPVKNFCIFEYEKIKNNSEFTIRDDLIAQLNKINKLFTKKNSFHNDDEIELYNDEKIIFRTQFSLNYDLKNKNIFYKIYNTKIDKIFKKNIIISQIKFIKKYIQELENLIDWDNIFEKTYYCNYCNSKFKYINISNFKLKYKDHKLILKPSYIVHNENCKPENNVFINKNIDKTNILNNYEKIIIKLMLIAKKNKITFYDQHITSILKKNNKNYLLPKLFVQITFKYGKNRKLFYLITMIQLKEKICKYQNNLFKIITDYLL